MTAIIDGISRLKTTSWRKAGLAQGLQAKTRRLAATARFIKMRAGTITRFVFASPGRLRLSSGSVPVYAQERGCECVLQACAIADMQDPAKAMTKSETAVADAAAYLRSQGIFVPRFELSPATGRLLGGSHTETYKPYRLCIGRFLTPYIRRWFAMHELGHLLWAEHDPLRSRVFNKCFGEPLPEDYNCLHRKHAWKTVAAGPLSRFAGPHRPRGQPSWYGALAGGEERFCELLAFMYANFAGFDAQPPPDLAGLWDACSRYGLKRMG